MKKNNTTVADVEEAEVDPHQGGEVNEVGDQKIPQVLNKEHRGSLTGMVQFLPV